MPLPAFGSTFTSTLTRGFWFQAPTGFVIVGLAVPNESNQSHQVVEVIDLGAAAPPAYPGLVTGTQLFYSNNTAGGSVIPCSIPIAAGSFIGILGACTPGIGSTTSANSYTSLAGPFASDILGIPTTITRFGTQFGIGAGGNQPCWQEAAATLSRVQVFCAPSGNGTFATNTANGQGCVRSYASLYENFAAPATYDLANSSMTFLPSGGGYIALGGIGTYLPPSGSATAIAIGDDVEQTVALTGSFPYPGGTTNALTVCSNGYVSVATGNGTGFTPVVATMLAFPQTAWGNWHDLFPTGGTNGNVKFEQIGSVAYVTWDAVIDFGSTSTNTWQLQFDTASGNVTYVWQTMSLAGNAQLVFYSQGGPNLDPGNTDLSVALASSITIGNTDVVPLALAATTRPVINTSWNLTTSNIPATGIIGIDVFGFADPGLNDLSFLGMPGCGLRATLDVLLAWPVAGATHNYSLAIPNNPTLVNLHVFTTSAVFQVPPVNAFGAITANGIDGKIGDL